MPALKRTDDPLVREAQRESFIRVALIVALWAIVLVTLAIVWPR